MCDLIQMSFHFLSEKTHLTYKTHMDEQSVRAMLDSKGAVKIYSFVHEVGDENEDNPTPYAHTHVFVWWKKHLNHQARQGTCLVYVSCLASVWFW